MCTLAAKRDATGKFCVLVSLYISYYVCYTCIYIWMLIRHTIITLIAQCRLKQSSETMFNSIFGLLLPEPQSVAPSVETICWCAANRDATG